MNGSSRIIWYTFAVIYLVFVLYAIWMGLVHPGFRNGTGAVAGIISFYGLYLYITSKPLMSILERRAILFAYIWIIGNQLLQLSAFLIIIFYSTKLRPPFAGNGLGAGLIFFIVGSLLLYTPLSFAVTKVLRSSPEHARH